MPCYDERNNPSYITEQHKNELKRLSTRCAKLTRLLCYLCKHTPYRIINNNSELEKWWEHHQKIDKKHAFNKNME